MMAQQLDDLIEGKQLFSERRFQEALPFFAQAIKDNPCPDSFRGHGFCLLSLNRPDEARSAFQRGLKQCGPDAELLFGLAMAEHACGEHQRAITALEKTLALDPEHQAARSCAEKMMADCTRRYLKEGKLLWAEDMIRRRLELDPHCADALATKIELEAKLGRHGDAKRTFRILAESAPHHPAIFDLARKLGLERQRERGFLY